MPQQTRDASSHTRLDVSGCLHARILVVAHDERARRWARRLRSVGFEVVTTGNRRGTLSATHGDSPDLIVVDHVVGHLDVPDLLAQFRGNARAAKIPILVTTTRVESGLASVCRALGATLLVVEVKDPRRVEGRNRRRRERPANVLSDRGLGDRPFTDRQSAFREVWEEGVAAGGFMAPRGRSAAPRQADSPKGR